jgi:hypothetical protein
VLFTLSNKTEKSFRDGKTSSRKLSEKKIGKTLIENCKYKYIDRGCLKGCNIRTCKMLKAKYYV